MIDKIFSWVSSYADSIGWALLVIVSISLLWGNK